MTGFKLGQHSREHLVGVHPDLVAVVERAIQLSSVDFTVGCGLRTIEEQKAAVASGNSTTMKSRHLTGHAVDLNALDPITKTISWSWPLYYQIAAAMKQAAAELGTPVRWGGAWMRLADIDDPQTASEGYMAARRAAGKRVFLDGPHFELPVEEYPATQEA